MAITTCHNGKINLCGGGGMSKQPRALKQYHKYDDFIYSFNRKMSWAWLRSSLGPSAPLLHQGHKGELSSAPWPAATGSKPYTRTPQFPDLCTSLPPNLPPIQMNPPNREIIVLTFNPPTLQTNCILSPPHASSAKSRVPPGPERGRCQTAGCLWTHVSVTLETGSGLCAGS